MIFLEISKIFSIVTLQLFNELKGATNAMDLILWDEKEQDNEEIIWNEINAFKDAGYKGLKASFIFLKTETKRE